MQTYWIGKANRNSPCVLFTWYNRAADMKLLFTVPWYDKIWCDIVTARCLLTVFVGSQPEHIALFMENLQQSAVALFMCGFVWVNGGRLFLWPRLCQRKRDETVGRNFCVVIPPVRHVCQCLFTSTCGGEKEGLCILFLQASFVYLSTLLCVLDAYGLSVQHTRHRWNASFRWKLARTPLDFCCVN